MRPPETHPATPAHLLDAVAPRFPLVPRSKPPCRALKVRLARVRDLAQAASRRIGDSLVRAAEAHNLAALIVSDCGLPDLARGLCWRQAELFLPARPFEAPTAKLALQPLVNLGRLLTRGGDGAGAYRLLDTLFGAVRSRADTVIDGREIALGDVVGDGDDHREVVRWLWAVLLSDGTRALTRAGRWADALKHLQRHKGVGRRLLDGRQVAILAHCAAGDHDGARAVLAGTDAATPWEQAVAACLAVLCLSLDGRPADSEVTAMVDGYLGLEPAPEHAAFRVRLGLCVLDLAADAPGVPEVADAVVRDALGAADAYAAHDALSHEACLAHATIDRSRDLADIVRAAGLARGSVPAEILDDLMESVRVGEASMADALAARAREHPVVPPGTFPRTRT